MSQTMIVPLSPFTHWWKASKFAKLCVPFCKKYNIQVRAPFRYFSGDSKPLQAEYELLVWKTEEAARKSVPCDITGEFAAFCNVERSNHPAIIKIILEHKEILPDALPNLVYISREKQPKQPHHYKAGAMNVLTRVSGVMTNAPFMLNVDCDMFMNNPQVVRHAMCQLLGSKSEKETAFVQYPQVFYNGSRDDPYGNQYVVFFKYMFPGMAGIQGSWYGGTDCFHRRKVIYGLWPDNAKNEAPNHVSFDGKLLDYTILSKEFGNSEEFIRSTAEALKGSKGFQNNLSKSLEAAYKVATCSYENGTGWGTKVDEPAIWIPIAIFVTFNLHTLQEYLKIGLSIRSWWNNPRMGRITATSAYLFGLLSVILKLLGLADTVFDITRKDQSSDGDDTDNVTKFTFNGSAIFVPGTTLMLVHLIALLALSSRLPISLVHGAHGVGIGEVFCSLWVVLCFWPFLKGLFEKGKYGIPSSTIVKSAALAFAFVHFFKI
ncbi:hypothetical protein DITRI_Ditri13aG0146100 [Diplodiscus trichospermus]